MVRRKINLIVVAAVVAAGIARPAVAQDGSRPMPPRELLHSVFEQGYEPLSPPVRRGGNYTLMAVDAESGVEMRLVVDGWTGAVLRARPRGLDELSPRFAPRFESARLSPPSVIPAEPRTATPQLPSVAAPTPKPRPLPRGAAKLPETKPLQPLSRSNAAEANAAVPAPVDGREDSAEKTSSSAMPAMQPLE